jgi:general stress protein YciG
MSGTKAGGIAAAESNKRKYGHDFYANIGRIGGAKSTKGGFWHKKYVLGDTESISRAGQMGGAKGKPSRRNKATKRPLSPSTATLDRKVANLRARLQAGEIGYLDYMERIRALEGNA